MCVFVEQASFIVFNPVTAWKMLIITYRTSTEKLSIFYGDFPKGKLTLKTLDKKIPSFNATGTIRLGSSEVSERTESFLLTLCNYDWHLILNVFHIWTRLSVIEVYMSKGTNNDKTLSCIKNDNQVRNFRQGRQSVYLCRSLSGQHHWPVHRLYRLPSLLPLGCHLSEHDCSRTVQPLGRVQQSLVRAFRWDSRQLSVHPLLCLNLYLFVNNLCSVWVFILLGDFFLIKTWLWAVKKKCDLLWRHFY